MAENAKPRRAVSRRVVIAGLSLVALLIIVGLVVVGGLSVSLNKKPAQSVVLQSDDTPSPEVASGEMLKQLRATEENALTTYGWVDRKNGIVHIPIDQAMNLLAQRGLPT